MTCPNASQNHRICLLTVHAPRLGRTVRAMVQCGTATCLELMRGDSHGITSFFVVSCLRCGLRGFGFEIWGFGNNLEQCEIYL